MPKKVVAPTKNGSPQNSTTTNPSRKSRPSRKRPRPNETGPMEVDDEGSFVLDYLGVNNSVFNSSCDHTAQRASIGSVPSKAQSKSVSTSISPESRRVRFGGESTCSQTENDFVDEEAYNSLQLELEGVKREKHQLGDALVAADFKISSLETQLELKEELIQSKEKEVLLKAQENAAYCDHIQAWRASVDEKMKSVEEENCSLKERNASLEEQIRSAMDRSEGCLKQIHSLKEQLENKERQVKNLQRELSHKQEELLQSNTRVRQLETNLSNLNEQVNILKVRMQQHQSWNKYF